MICLQKHLKIRKQFTWLPKKYQETLKELRKDFKLCIVSSGVSVWAYYDFKNIFGFNLKKHFDLVLFSQEQGFLKESGKLFQIALKKLRLKPKQAAFIGDLPLLSGSDENADKVWHYYQQMTRALAPLDLTIIAVNLADSGNWSVLLNNGIKVYFGNMGFTLDDLKHNGYARKECNCLFYKRSAASFEIRPFIGGKVDLFKTEPTVSIKGRHRPSWASLKFIFGLDAHRKHTAILQRTHTNVRLLSYYAIFNKAEDVLT